MPPLPRSAPYLSPSTATAKPTPPLHTLLLLASALLLQLDLTTALPHPAPRPTNPSINPSYPPTYADHVLLHEDRHEPKAARPFGHPGAASIPVLLSDAAHVAAAAGAARAASHAQGRAGGPASRITVTWKQTRIVTLPVLAAATATTTAAVTVTHVYEEEEEEETELPPPILPPTPTILLLEGLDETLLLDASRTTAPTAFPAPTETDPEKEATPRKHQWLHDSEIEDFAGDTTGSRANEHARDRGQLFLELGQTGSTSASDDGGGRGPEGKEMGRGAGGSISSSRSSASGVADGGATKAVTTEWEEIDANTTPGLNDNHMDEVGRGGGGSSSSSSRSWKDEV